MTRQAIALASKASQVPELWSPRVVAELNDYQFKVARVHGEFVWHRHDETDEAFLVLEGELTIELRDGEVRLAAGDLWVVPRGVEHRPVARAECRILLIEPRGVVNTGDAGGYLTAPGDVCFLKTVMR